MKTYIVTLIFAAWLLVLNAALAKPIDHRKDTVTIDFGNNSKIIIYFENKEDLQTLNEYDINQMLEDLSISIDSAENAQMLTIQDSSGTRYLQDTIIEIDRFDEDFYAQLDDAKRRYDLEPFHKIEIGNAFDINIAYGDKYEMIAISRKEARLDDLTILIEDGTLKVSLKPKIINRMDVELFITTSELNDLKLSGASSTEVEGFSTDKMSISLSGAADATIDLMADLLDVKVSGASDLKLKGAGEFLNAEVYGASELRANNFEVNEAKVRASGASDAVVNALDLDAQANGASEIKNVYSESGLRQGLVFEDNKVRIKIGNMEIVADTDKLEDEWEDVEDLEDVKNITDQEEYIDDEVPSVKHTVNFDLGMNNYLSNGDSPNNDGANYAVRPYGSWYVGIHSVHKFHLGGSLFLEWGKGLSWYNFKFEDDAMRINRVDDQLIFEPDPRDVDPIKSKLVVSYLNMSLVPVIDFGKGSRKVKKLKADGFEFTQSYRQGFRMGVGPYVGYRLSDRTKFVFRDSGRNRDKSNGNFMTNTLRYGIRTQIGYRGWDIFFNYDLNELFQGENNPQLNAFSFGITL